MRTYAGVLLPLLFALSASADPCSREELKQVCAYSSGPFCRNAQFAPQDPQGVYDYLGKNWGKLKDAAKIYGVSREALIGAMVAAYAINPPLAGTKFVLDWTPAEFNQESRTSVDPTGITMAGALEAESVAANVEGAAGRRKNATPFTPGQVADRLVAGQSSIYYAAALLKQAQDAYAALPDDGRSSQFYRIEGKPEVLATLYLLGGAEKRAKTLAEENAKDPQNAHPPRMSDFGWYVGCKMGDIRAFIAKQDQAATAPASATTRTESGKTGGGTHAPGGPDSSTAGQSAAPGAR